MQAHVEGEVEALESDGAKDQNEDIHGDPVGEHV